MLFAILYLIINIDKHIQTIKTVPPWRPFCRSGSIEVSKITKIGDEKYISLLPTGYCTTL